MPGTWVLDDSQSLYYQESDDEFTSPSNSIPREDVTFLSPYSNQTPIISQPNVSTITFPILSHDPLIETSFNENNIYQTPQFDLQSDDQFLDERLWNSEVTELINTSNEADDTEYSPKELNQSLDLISRTTLFDQTFIQPLSGLKLIMGYNTRLPLSRLDVYITALRQLVLCCGEKSSLRNDLKRTITAEGVLWVVREAWPAAESYWNLTATFRGFLYAELWRNFPCERSYRQLPPAYRPTRAQLTIPHSPMIDWMPWPDLRDLAIMYQDQIDVDALFRMAIHNVVAHRKKKENQYNISQNNDQTSFRVWDLVCLEKSNGTDPIAEPGLNKKPILHSPSLRALLRAYNLEYDEFETQKLDDCFFETYPFLYCDTAISSWKVKGFPTLPQEDVGRPVELTRSAVFRLKSRFESLTNVEIEI